MCFQIAIELLVRVGGNFARTRFVCGTHASWPATAQRMTESAKVKEKVNFSRMLPLLNMEVELGNHF